MTPARLLAEIAFKGSYGLSPYRIRFDWGDSLRVLIDLGLVVQDSNGCYVATTEKGFYPIINSLGRMHSSGTCEMGHTSHFGRRKVASL
jgi:hypothetical protein